MRSAFCRRNTWCKLFVFISKLVEYIKISQKAVSAFLPIDAKNAGHFGLHNFLSEMYLNRFILRWIAVNQSVSIKAYTIVSIIIKMSLSFIKLVAILKIAAILDSTILIVCLHVFVCAPVQHKLYTFNFKLFFNNDNKILWFFFNLAAILKMTAILDLFNLGP